MRVLAPVALAVAVLATAPVVAEADRDATPEERTAILTRFVPAVDHCFDVTVSTQDERWAAVVAGTPPLAGCDTVGDGLLLSHRDPTGAWTIVYEGSAGTQTCPQLGLPTPVGLDLRVCPAPVPAAQTTIVCWTGNRPVQRRKPSACKTGPGASAPMRLTKLRWRHWGRSTATATGRLFDSGRQLQTRVTVSRVEESAGRREYTRLTMRSGRYNATVRLGADVP